MLMCIRLCVYAYVLADILQYLAVEKELGVNRDHANKNGESRTFQNIFIRTFSVCADRAF
jgi:hypothetical protein